jgi:hypothetical protein
MPNLWNSWWWLIQLKFEYENNSFQNLWNSISYSYPIPYHVCIQSHDSLDMSKMHIEMQASRNGTNQSFKPSYVSFLPSYFLFNILILLLAYNSCTRGYIVIFTYVLTTYLSFTPPSFLLFLYPLLLRTISTSFIILFSCINTKYICHIHPHSPFPYLPSSWWYTPPEKVLSSYTWFFKSSYW